MKQVEPSPLYSLPLSLGSWRSCSSGFTVVLGAGDDGVQSAAVVGGVPAGVCRCQQGAVRRVVRPGMRKLSLPAVSGSCSKGWPWVVPGWGRSVTVRAAAWTGSRARHRVVARAAQ